MIKKFSFFVSLLIVLFSCSDNFHTYVEYMELRDKKQPHLPDASQPNQVTPTPLFYPVNETPIPSPYITALPTASKISGIISTPTPVNNQIITATPTSTPVATATPTSTPVATATPTSTPVVTATPTSTPVVTATPTSTPEIIIPPPPPVVTATPTSTPVVTATPTSTPVATATPTSTPVATATPTSTPVATATPTSTPVATATPTSTPVMPPSTPGLAEAEDVPGDLITVINNSEASGEKCIEMPNEVSAYVEFTIYSDSTEWFDLTCTYSNGGPTTTRFLYVNDEYHSELMFYSTGSFNDFVDADSYLIRFNAGNNVLRIVGGTGDGLKIFLDAIDLD